MPPRIITAIVYGSHFERAFKKLPRTLKAEVHQRTSWFSANCFDSRLKTHKLTGKLDGHWSFSITRKHRVLFEFLADTEVYFEDVDDHDMYR